MKKFIKALKTYFENPQLILIFIAFYAIISLVSLIKLTSSTAITDYIFLIVPRIFFLLLSSLFFSLFIGSSYLFLKNKYSMKKSFHYLKFWFGNFIYLIMFVIINLICLLAANYLGVFILKLVSASIAPYLQAILYYLLFVAISSFFLMQFFFFTLENKGFFNSIKTSIILSKSNYLKIFIIPIIYFLISILINQINVIFIKDAIYFLVIYPIFTLVLTILFTNIKNQKNVPNK